MPNFMRDGGIGMWFILLFGAITLIGAVLFARRPDQLRLATLRALTVVTFLSSFTAFTAGVAKSLAGVTRIPPQMRDSWQLLVARGVSESCANLIFGSTLLTLAWLVIAIGLRRLATIERTRAAGSVSPPAPRPVPAPPPAPAAAG